MTTRVIQLIVLPTALAVGCTGLDANCSGDACECAGADDCDDTQQTDFSATLRSVAPYGWSGDHYVWPYDDSSDDPACTDVAQCDAEIDRAYTYKLSIRGDKFLCVGQIATVNEDGEVLEVSVEWIGEGICGLAPDGEYSGWNVDTDIHDFSGFDQIWISIASYEAVVTKDTFFYEDSEYLLEGWISEDLRQVYFHRVLETGETEQTLELE